MKEEIHNLKNQALALIQEAQTEKELEELRVAFLGRKGKINDWLKKIPALSEKEKKEAGLLLNEVKNAIEQAIESKKQTLRRSKGDLLQKKFFDVELSLTCFIH